jgi:hypothetical protein
MTIDRRQARVSGRRTEKDAEPEVEIKESVAEPTAKPLDEFLGRAQKAYITYLEAQKRGVESI